MSITQWGSREGLRILKKLSKLYWNLVWESTVLLALCSGEYDPGPNEFARADLDALFPPDSKVCNGLIIECTGMIVLVLVNIASFSF